MSSSTNQNFPKGASNAQRAHKKSVRNRIRNVAIKRRIKSVMKEILTLVKEGKKEKASEVLDNVAQSLLHKSVSKGVLHKNTAARRISRLARSIKSIQ